MVALPCYEAIPEFPRLEDLSGIDPQAPTDAIPGSEEKILVLMARYDIGADLWHPEDRQRHGPSDNAYRHMLQAAALQRDDEPEFDDDDDE